MFFVCGLILIAGFLFTTYSFLETYWLKVTPIDIVDEDIPPVFVNKKIVFVSDIHHGIYFSAVRIAGLVEKINQLAPDIIILGGDYADGGKGYIVSVFSELAKLKPKIAVAGVLGNHDYLVDSGLVKQEMQKAGIKILDNQAQWISVDAQGINPALCDGALNTVTRCGIKIGGVADFTQALADLGSTIDDASKKDFVILVAHNPDYTEEIKTDKIDLIFSGHTHGGQITFFGQRGILSSRYGQKFLPTMVDIPSGKLIISKGIGTVELPFRFFARPEIIVVTLKNSF